MKITHSDIRMYKTGTGDCFVLKFFHKEESIFNMMIDGGTWSGSKEKLTPYIKNLKSFVGNKLDVLVITHEHKDHVHLFDVCIDLFTQDFEIDEIWMAWCEEDGSDEVEQWKKDFGQKKKALADASRLINNAIVNQEFEKQFKNSFGAAEAMSLYENISESLLGLSALHFKSDTNQNYLGGLEGLENIKNLIANNNIRYLKQGESIRHEKLQGVKFHVLGPPNTYEEIKKLKGRKGTDDTYEHNKVLEKSDSFSMAVSNLGSISNEGIFDAKYVSKSDEIKNYYNSENTQWRGINLDWLISGATNLALRLDKGINNLSLVLAMEFEDTKKVMLFPGDAEFGSWESWHKIDWKDYPDNFTEDLLSRVVFYKVAHHLSHNGTAKAKGLELMTSKNMVSMATLDFDVISKWWKSTMPNRALVKELIRKTKGRLIIMNDKNMYYDFKNRIPISDKIEEGKLSLTKQELKEYKENYKNEEYFHEYRLKN
jgi:beta-lactamase superfamily II metal-dependent hydrolase